MKKITDETEWNADDGAPMTTKGRKGADYNNQTINASEKRFPWATIIIAIVLLATVGVVVFVLNGMS